MRTTSRLIPPRAGESPGIGVLTAILVSTASLAACSANPAEPPPRPSATTSTITSSVTALVADGGSTATITVTLRDAKGAPIGQPVGAVTMHATAGTLSPVTANANGTYTATDTAPLQLGVDTVTASLDGTPLSNILTIPLVAGPPSQGYWIAPRTWLYADGITSTDMTIVILDAHSHPVMLPPAAVTMTTTRGILSAVGGSSGFYLARITSTTSDETAVVAAQVNGLPFGPTLSVRFDHRHWVAKAPLPVPRMSLGVAAINGVLYAVGGTAHWAQSVSVDWVNRLEAYDPVANTWTARTAMPTARTDLAVGVVAGVLYAVGGHNSGDLTAVEAYNPATDTWSARAPMPTARGGLAVGVANGILYAIGGRLLTPGSSYLFDGRESQQTGRPGAAPGRGFADVPGSGAVNVVEAYDPSTNTWTAVAPMPTPRSHLGVAVIDGIVYAVGGQSGTNHLATVEAYDPAANQWTTRAPMPYELGALAVVALGGKLYAIGGSGAYSGLAAVEVYDPATNVWTSTGPMINARFAFGAAAINGLLYAIGGACYDVIYPDVEVFNP
jgi:N-acetylneuraminic acid mutarotase